MNTAFPRTLILGCGFTGRRVARTLLENRGVVIATSRDERNLQHLAESGATVLTVDVLDPRSFIQISTLVDNVDAIIISVPSIRIGETLADPVSAIVDALRGRPPRAIYLSTTGVYGRQTLIDEGTPIDARTPRETARAEAEQAVLQGFAYPLILRPAAIYGPGRGVHVSLRENKYRLTGDGSNYISRIHVDDLAAHVVAALSSDVTGAWPVADDHPCTQREMAEYCASLLGLPPPPSAEPGANSETLRANRRVDGSAIRKRLGIELRYPSYKEGVPASIAAEQRDLSGGRQ